MPLIKLPMVPQLIETAPKDGRWLLLFCPVQKRWGAGKWCCPKDRNPELYKSVKAGWVKGFWSGVNQPSHWLPQPENPY
jgi:hypothetical protein